MQQLHNQMKLEAAKLNFEKAAEIRDQIESLKELQNKQRVYDTELKDHDIIGLYTLKEELSLALLSIREGKLMGKVDFYFENIENISEVLSLFIEQYYSRLEDIPPQIILPIMPDEHEAILEFLEEKSSKKINFFIPQIGKKKDLLKLAEQNAELRYLERQKLTKKEISLIEIKDILKLKNEPRRIECFDIANTEGKLSVAAMVSFYNGYPDKSNYRYFRIKTKDTPDDYSMIREAVFRRYSRLKRENKSYPDLIIIDGGKGQLSSALSVLKDLEIDIPIIGLAKKEETIFQENDKIGINLAKNSEALKILQSARDEAHRFGNTLHKKLRGKNALKSILDDIAGIGNIRKKSLLKSFKSIEDLSNASIDDLLLVDKMNKKAA